MLEGERLYLSVFIIVTSCTDTYLIEQLSGMSYTNNSLYMFYDQQVC